MNNPPPLMKNAHLDGDAFLIEGNDIGVVLLHGFTATTAEVRLLADYLRGFGYTLAAPLLPGHGTQPAELNKTSWLDWYAAAEGAYLELRGKCTKVFVCGESMGALACSAGCQPLPSSGWRYRCCASFTNPRHRSFPHNAVFR